MKAYVITLSDRVSSGIADDLSGKLLLNLLKNNSFEIGGYKVLPDDKKGIESTLINIVDNENPDLILTTGGTGLSPRDITPEATLAISDRVVPGISELIRLESMKKTPFASLSRGVGVIRKNTLIINFPGKPKSVEECFEILLPIIPHAIDMLGGGKHNDEQYLKEKK